MQLYSYFRSSAAFRVRAALGLKGLSFDVLPVHLRRNGGLQHGAEFSSMNPEKLVPVLDIEGDRLTQSLAILEYIEERFPTPALLPSNSADRAWVRALSLRVACDIHPLNNLRVLHYLEGPLAVSPEQKHEWVSHWIDVGFTALEKRLASDGRTGTCCFGDEPSFADCCLVPQVANARRFGVDLSNYPTLSRVDAHLMTLPPFIAAAPDAQVDAE